MARETSRVRSSSIDACCAARPRALDAVALSQVHFKNALGSLYELVAAVDVSEALGLITAEQLAEALGLAYRARGMLAALVNR